MNSDFPEAMLVDPGRHSMRVEYNYYQSTAHANLWLDAQAEKKYIIRCKVNGNFVLFWIEEEATGQRVGGVEHEDTPSK
ncbi:MAG: hypothetical protein B7Y56_13370 [Gallionellales bacterium 35-53-114]|nr:MAG: hypothetical protein B7Y56_13370 [Gallionellales bacterium 35-53-114]OZB08945.1 MAG: hypothetical protein B7X61_08155 [Gallionellales bacterium 39-52-133]